MRSKPQSNARRSCDKPRSVLAARSTWPKDVCNAEMSTAIEGGRYEWLDCGSTDYSPHPGMAGMERVGIKQWAISAFYPGS